MLLILLAPGLALAQEDPLSADAPPPSLTATSPRGPAGVTLSVVGRTRGVPVVLHALSGEEGSPLSAVVAENTSPLPLTQLTVSITLIPASGTARRRLITVPVELAPGEREDSASPD